VAPYFWLNGVAALAASLALSGIALALIGTATSLFTGRGIFSASLRQLLIGYGAAAITFAIGRLAGVALAG